MCSLQPCSLKLHWITLYVPGLMKPSNNFLVSLLDHSCHMPSMFSRCRSFYTHKSKIWYQFNWISFCLCTKRYGWPIPFFVYRFCTIHFIHEESIKCYFLLSCRTVQRVPASEYLEIAHGPTSISEVSEDYLKTLEWTSSQRCTESMIRCWVTVDGAEKHFEQHLSTISHHPSKPFFPKEYSIPRKQTFQWDSLWNQWWKKRSIAI